MSDLIYDNLEHGIYKKGDDYAYGPILHGRVFPVFLFPGGSFEQDVEAAKTEEATAASRSSSDDGEPQG